jgi:hypothetical protein
VQWNSEIVPALDMIAFVPVLFVNFVEIVIDKLDYVIANGAHSIPGLIDVWRSSAWQVSIR